MRPRDGQSPEGAEQTVRCALDDNSTVIRGKLRRELPIDDAYIKRRPKHPCSHLDAAGISVFAAAAI